VALAAGGGGRHAAGETSPAIAAFTGNDHPCRRALGGAIAATAIDDDDFAYDIARRFGNDGSDRRSFIQDRYDDGDT
jgi:hypothetical protein